MTSRWSEPRSATSPPPWSSYGPSSCSRSYALREENFYFAALRSYLELHDNYFLELEKAVDDFALKYALPELRPVPPRLLGNLLETNHGYTIVTDGLDAHPDLKMLRSVFLPEKQELLLNGDLSAVQRGFQFGKELALRPFCSL